MTTETLVYVGDAIKALDDNGKVGGYLVRFGSADAPDLTGDFFTPDTDFDVSDWPHKTTVYYNHGLDRTLKNRRLGFGTLTMDDVGVWVEAQLNLRDEYEQAVYGMVKEGKMGWSSGTAGHLVERQPAGKAQRIAYWPLGLDASITPTPAEYRNQAVGMKALMDEVTPEPEAQPEGAEANAPVNAKSGDDTAVVDEVKQMVPTENTTMSENTVPQAAPELATLVADIAAIKAALQSEPAKIQVPFAAPALNKTGFGDSEVKALAHYVRTGDVGALGHAYKASNDTDMNVTTAADGGYAVPTGHYQGIIARRDEDMLANKLGVMRIPGKGLTVNVPVDNEADGEFVTKSEATAFDRDAPALDQKAMTLVKYTKTVQISDELLADEDSNLLAFLNDFIGRGIAKTHNSLLITALLAGGTAALTLDSATAIGATEIPELVYKLPAEYADNAAWIMARGTEGYIRGLASTSEFQFAPGNVTRSNLPELWGYPVFNSAYASAIGASAKSLIFGNFRFVGMRDSGLQFLRNPYLLGNSGQVALHYSFRTVYSVLQAEAVAYATHPSA